MKQEGLNDNHLRRLATSMAMVDAAAARILDLLDERTTPKRMTVLDRTSLSPAQRTTIRDLVAQLQPAAEELGKKYGLGKHAKDLRRSVSAEISQVWTILEDTHAKNLKGMGPVPEDAATKIDQDVNEMLLLVRRIMRAVQPDEQ